MTDSTILNYAPVLTRITLQNIPDGLVVSMPFVRSSGRKKALFWGIMSGVVEPVVAILIIFLSEHTQSITILEPTLIGFSLTAIFLIVMELWRECKDKVVAVVTMCIFSAVICF